MKRNKTIIWITIILLVIVAFLYYTSSSGTFSSKEKDFAVQDTATVTKIFLADKDNNTILLERDSTGTWQLNNTYKARQSGVNLLLETLKNLVPKYPVPENAHNRIVSLMASQSVKVEVYQQVYRVHLSDNLEFFPHEKRTKTFYVGTATADNMGTFMLKEGADVPFVVHLLGLRGFVGPRFSTEEANWRDHTIFKTKLFNIESVTMEMPGDPANSYKVESTGDNFRIVRLIDNQVMPSYDTLKLLNFLTAFNDIRYETLMNKIQPERMDSVKQTTPFHILTLTDADGKISTIKTFHKPNDDGTFDMFGNPYPYDRDRLYGFINDDRDFVLIQFYVFDKVLRPLSYFRPEYE